MAKSRFCQRFSLCDGLMVIIGSCLLIAGILLAILHQPKSCAVEYFQDQLKIKPNSSVVKSWKNPIVAVDMKFYIFNVTNGPDILRGAKPVLVECGPYTYRMLAPRYDIEFYDNGTVSFRNNHILHFRQDLSNGSENDLLYHVNIPLVAVISKMEDRSSLFSRVVDYFHQTIDNELVQFYGVKNFIVRHTAKEILFGYRDPMFQRISEVVGYFGANFDPYFGLFHNFNNTDDGIYLVNTGIKNFSNLNLIEKWNGDKYLHYWSTKYANMINGTDGSFLRPFVKRDEPRYFYFSWMCRSLKLTYEKDSTVKRVKSYRYHFADDLLKSAAKEPDNIGFCVPEGNCLGSGVLNAGACGHDAPIWISLPHFYLASKEYRSGVIGLRPNKTLHDSTFEVEPMTGAVLRGKRQIQLNVHVRRSKHMDQLKHVRTVLLPYLWLGGVSVTDDETAKLMHVGLSMLEFSTYIPYVMIVLGCLMFTKLLCGCDRTNGTLLIDDKTDNASLLDNVE